MEALPLGVTSVLAAMGNLEQLPQRYTRMAARYANDLIQTMYEFDESSERRHLPRWLSEIPTSKVCYTTQKRLVLPPVTPD